MPVGTLSYLLKTFSGSYVVPELVSGILLPGLGVASGNTSYSGYETLLWCNPPVPPIIATASSTGNSKVYSIS